MKALQFNVTTPQFVATKLLAPIFGKQTSFRGPLKTTRLVDIPEPTLPAEDWVKLRTLYCGFCGSDLNLMLLHDSPTASPFSSFPCISGHEVVAEVAETGSHVSDFKVGDIVALNPSLGCETRGITPPCPSCQAGQSSNCENLAEGALGAGMFIGINKSLNGGFAPYLVAHQSQLFKVPPGVSLEAAAMVEPLAVALQSVFDNLPEAGDKVLVIGGGVIGNLLIQSLRVLAPNSPIALVEPSPFAAELARNKGAQEIIAWPQVFERSEEVTGATAYKPMLGEQILMGGYDRIYDTVGNTATLNLSLRLLAALGTLSVVGIGSEVKLDLTPLWLKKQRVQGVYGYGQVDHQGQRRHVFEVGLELMRQGRIDADVLVTHKFSIDEYQQMIEVNLNKGRHRAVKTLMSFVNQ